MSEATKRKHVVREVLEDYPEPTGDQQIVRVLGPKGNNLHEVQEASGGTYLCSMPTKFRKSIWVKRGDFVIVEPIHEGDKVKAEIQHILFPEQIRELQKDNKWPTEFGSKLSTQDTAADYGMDDEEEGSDKSDEEDDEGRTTTTEPQMDAFGNYIGGEEGEGEESSSEDGDE